MPRRRIPTSKELKDSAWAVAKMAPLAGSILAPIATLYSIPALSQRWYGYQGMSVPDSKSSVALSAVSLALTVLATVTLFMRFSKAQVRWRLLTTISTVVWTIDTIIQIVNLAVFSGDTDATDAGYGYLEGFWCAIWAVILSGTTASFLIFHLMVEIGRPPEDDPQVRMTGANFLRNITALIAVVALEALIFSRVEDWEYFDAIYFAVVTMLTIGFGDYYPTHTSTRVLLFFFALITISLLANIVSMLVSFMSALVDVRRQKWRSDFRKRAEQKFGDEGSRPEHLEDEVSFLNNLQKKEERWSQLYDLGFSMLAFLSFWLVGAVIFMVTEGWSYGIAVYFCYVFFFTLGYGDYSPKSAAGRTFFCLYAVMAVPIIASFALQAVANIVTSVTQGSPSTEDLKKDHGEQVLKPHAEFVEEHRREIEKGIAERQEQHRRSSGSSTSSSTALNRSIEQHLLAELLQYACSLEAQARRIILNQLDAGSQPVIVLQADQNQMLRDMRSLGLSEQALKDIAEANEAGNADILKQTVAYRKTFAQILATGSRLRALHGKDEAAFERRRDPETEKRGGDGAARGADLSNLTDSQEAAQGAGGHGDKLNASKDQQQAREEQEQDGGPSAGAQKAMNLANV